MALEAHELKAIAIELDAAMPPDAEPKQERECASIDMLFNEMDAVIECIQDKMLDHTNKRDRNVAHALVMVLERLNNELGRTAGVIA